MDFAETAKTIPVIGNFLADKGTKVIGKFGMSTDKQLEPIGNDFSIPQKLSDVLGRAEPDASENTNTASDRVARMQQEGIYMPDDGTATKSADAETQVGND